MATVRWFLYRLRAVLHRRRHEQAIEDELRFHLEEEEARLRERGVSPAHAATAARRDLGNPLAIRAHTRDVWTWPRLEQVLRDLRYGWRQVARTKVRSAAAILSLGIALGACVSTFMVMDALLFRPLAVAGAERLHVMTRWTTTADGQPRSYDGVEYPLFERMRSSVTGADMFAVSFAWRTDLTYGSDQDMERAQVQFVSGRLFDAFELRPALGRTLHADDDRVPGGHPQAVITDTYWSRRFGRAPDVLGRTVRIGLRSFEIVGVVEPSFTGTEPGVIVDIMLPAAMHPSVGASDNSWLRVLVRLEPGVAAARVRDQMQAQLAAFHRERAATFVNVPPALVQRFLNERLVLEAAASGASGLQARYRDGLTALAGLVGLVLLVACANVANLMLARTAARTREMALRASLGAGRAGLLQLVLAEHVWIGLCSAVVGVAFGLAAAPSVVARVSPSDAPAQLLLRADGRAALFVLAVTVLVTAACGSVSAWMSTRVRPGTVLRGGHTPHSFRRAMHALVVVQVAFCVVVVFVSGLFVTTLQRLTEQSLGFDAERLLVVRVASPDLQPPHVFEQLADALGTLPGVTAVSASDHTLLDGANWNNAITVDGVLQMNMTYLRAITPGWLATMRIPLRAGRDLRPEEMHPQAAIVNETFVRTFLGGGPAVGRVFSVGGGNGRLRPVRIVGVTGDVRYRSLREPVLPIAFVPFRLADTAGGAHPRREAALLIRTGEASPAGLAAALRREVARLQPALYVGDVRTQSDIVAAGTIRERLLAVLSGFFAAVTLLLSAIGMYGVLDYAVLQRRREIGICLALGAPVSRVLRTVCAGIVAMAAGGSALGLLIGVLSGRYVDPLLFGIEGTASTALLAPVGTVLAVIALACLPPTIRALRTDLTATIRAQ